MSVRRYTGFTLIELMIVITIIAIIVAIALPNILRSRIEANEVAAIQNLRTIVGAEASYHYDYGQYTLDFATLYGATPPYLPQDMSQVLNGYQFTLEGTVNNFNALATPVAFGNSGTRGFFIDSSGIVRFEPGAQAHAGSAPIGNEGAG